MPITRTLTLYTYDELDDEAKEIALETIREFKISDNWTKTIYDDAESIGLKITGFDLNNRTIKGEMIGGIRLPECCKRIRKQHGKDSNTFETAKLALKEYITAFNYWIKKAKNMEKYKDVNWKPCEWFKEFNGRSGVSMVVQLDFEEVLMGDYYKMLENQYNYLTSDEGIIDTIRNNEYFFHNNGTFVGSLNYTK